MNYLLASTGSSVAHARRSHSNIISADVDTTQWNSLFVCIFFRSGSSLSPFLFGSLAGIICQECRANNYLTVVRWTVFQWWLIRTVNFLLKDRQAYTGCTDAPNPLGQSGRAWCYVRRGVLSLNRIDQTAVLVAYFSCSPVFFPNLCE